MIKTEIIIGVLGVVVPIIIALVVHVFKESKRITKVESKAEELGSDITEIKKKIDEQDKQMLTLAGSFSSSVSSNKEYFAVNTEKIEGIKSESSKMAKELEKITDNVTEIKLQVALLEKT